MLVTSISASIHNVHCCHRSCYRSFVTRCFASDSSLRLSTAVQCLYALQSRTSLMTYKKDCKLKQTS